MSGFLEAHRLSAILFLPGFAGIILLLFPDRLWESVRRAAAAVALGDLVLAAFLLRDIDPAGGFQAVENIPWIQRYGISYFLGIDGLGLTMIFLTLALVPVALLAPFDGLARNRSSFFGAILLTETSLLGVFMSLDLVLFYVFWEAMLIPAWFIIGLWGGEGRIAAAVRFFIYTLAGSLLMLAGILILYNHHQAVAGYGSASLPSLLGVHIPAGLQGVLFGLFFLGFAVKAPLFPFHSWLPDAYTEAPTGGSIIMAAIMAKMGVYGLLRFCLTLFPQASVRWAPWVVSLALAGFIYGAFLALAQDDVKRLVAFSSLSHMNFMVLGIFGLTLLGATGSAVLMVSHGLVTGGLFLVAGMIGAGCGTRKLGILGGSFAGGPRTRWALTFFALASLGMPGLASFIGEFLVVSGGFQYRLTVGFLSVFGVALGAYYFLNLLGKTAFGEASGEVGASWDLSAAETALLLPLAAAILWLGLFPGPLIRAVGPVVEGILKRIGGI